MSKPHVLKSEIRLSPYGLQRVNECDSRPFCFAVGDSKYWCSVSQACFISPCVFRLLLTDYTVGMFYVDVEDPDLVFKDILELGSGSSVTVDQDNIGVIRSIAIALENGELYSRVLECEVYSESADIHSTIKTLLECRAFGLLPEKEISFLASHFDQLDPMTISRLSIAELEKILQSSKLQINDENSLLEMIIELCLEDADYFIMFRYVRIQRLDVIHFEAYFNFVREYNDPTPWMPFYYYLRDIFRLYSGVLPSSLPISRFRGDGGIFDLVTDPAFYGIISHLAKVSGGNVHEMGRVDITSCGDQYNQCHQVTNYGWTGCWLSRSTDSGFAWICFDFKDSRVNLTKYSVKSGNIDMFFMIHWVIEGSNDRIDWTILDKRNTLDLYGNSKIATYSCNSGISQSFRYLKLRMTGANTNGGSGLCLAQLEFFGELSYEQ